MKIQARIDRMVNKGNVKAIASVSLDGMFVVKNLKIMDGKKGMFVSMPQESYPDRDGNIKYSNTFFALTNSARTDLQEAVLEAYKLSLDPSYVPKQSYGQDSGYQQNFPQSCAYQQEQYPQPQYPEPEYPDWAVASDDIQPMDLY